MTIRRKPHESNPYSSFAHPTKISLKRTELKRKKPMRRESAKKAKEKRATDALRHWYIEAGYPCQICRGEPAVHPHEITAGAYRHRAVYDSDAQLYLCANCHEWLQGEPYSYQAAMRVAAIADGINACTDCNAVTLEGIGVELIKLAERRNSPLPSRR